MTASGDGDVHEHIDLGPAVRLVLGEDRLVGTHEPDHRPDGVSHLRTTTSGRDIMVLRQGDGGSGALTNLADRLIWLNGRAGAPEVVASGRNCHLHEALVIRLAASAIVASDPYQPIDPESLARLVGSTLREVHSIDLDNCPYESPISTWRSLAAAKVLAGEIETASSGPYSRLAPAELLEILDEMIESSKAVHDEVLIHGMATTAHMWIVPDATIVFTGWQMSGIGDRHHDLAVAAASLTERFGPALVPPMLESYGLDLVDPQRLDLHQLLVYLAGVAS